MAYIDDLLILSSEQHIADYVKADLEQWFMLKDLGQASEFIGIAIHNDENRQGMYLNQANPLRQALKEFNTEKCKPITAPMESNAVGLLRKRTDSAVSVPYMEAISSLIYFATCTQLDSAYAVGTLARYCEKPTQTHCKLVKRMFGYLLGTETTVMVCRRTERDALRQFKGYTDSDWGGLPSRRSTSGSTLFYNGCLIA